MIRPVFTRLLFASLALLWSFSANLSAQELTAAQAPKTDANAVAALTADKTSELDSDHRLEQILTGNQTPKTIDDLRAMQDHISALAERVKQATVAIDCGGAQGSGVIVSRDGLVLTAAHVIGEPGLDATIRLADGRVVAAKTRGLVHVLDSGLLKIAEPGNYTYLDMGESGTLKQGQWVMAIGHPGGYEAARGMVVRVGRILSLTSRVIRTDCTLVGGDSGGPLIDMNGYVVGIHSRIGARLSDNMHVPIDVYSDGWDELESGKEVGGRPANPNLGITLKGEEGLEIESLQPGGPAEIAGMKVGDTIIAMAGKSINTRDQLREEIARMSVGSEVDVKVLRENEEVELKIVIGRKP